MKKILASTIAVLLPSIALAQRQVNDVNSLNLKLTGIGNTIITILISVAVIYIIYNTVLFIIHAGSDDRKTYQAGILWGVVGLFVILSIWGLVAILSNTFNTQNQAPINEYPQNPNPASVQ